MTNPKPQRIVWPWETTKWPEMKRKITDKINSIVDMDSRIASMFYGKIKPKIITELFNLYYSDTQLLSKVPQDVFIEKIIPMMQKFIEDAPKTFKGFDSRVLLPGQDTNVCLTRPQTATLIVGIWFGIFNYNYLSKGQCTIEDFPEPTFLHIFLNQNMFALQCILNYFHRVYKYINSTNTSLIDIFNAGNIIIQRSVLTENLIPKWMESTVPITDISIGEGLIDAAPTKMHMAFAHEFIGGNLFQRSLSQEEIVLLVRPESLMATIFCARMNDNEAIVVMGAERMSHYSGYGAGVKFQGNFQDETPLGYSKDQCEVMLQSSIIFVDASKRTSSNAQFVGDFQRDLNKVYCGFDTLQFGRSGVQIAGGNWAYEFNGNNMHIKFIQQVLAATQSGKSLVYYPFSREFEEKLLPFIEWIINQKLTVGELFEKYVRMIDSCTSTGTRMGELDIFACIIDNE